MEHLYAPWRSAYAGKVKKEKVSMDEAACVFCAQLAEDNDEQHFILRRFSQVSVLLNRFPYNAGHLLILPHSHASDLQDLSQQARMQIMEVTTQSVTILRETLGAQGVNLGANLGRVAGAGIPGHVHMHVLPRWAGDTNYLPLLADTKQISFDLHEIYQKLREPFVALNINLDMNS